MPTENIQSVLSDLSYRLANLETKIRLNEQNFFNSQEKVQLLSKNFLDLKKELLNRVDNLTQEMHEVEKAVLELKKKVSSFETKITVAPQQLGFRPLPPVEPHNISPEQAKSALDDVLRRLEAH
ncbi:TPA: hypothetical protein H1012_00105 [archaeon]|nr:hypothetical protein [Candidatus Naiadarchaeales archaeon SRR2090159.bin1288]